MDVMSKGIKKSVRHVKNAFEKKKEPCYTNQRKNFVKRVYNSYSSKL